VVIALVPFLVRGPAYFRPGLRRLQGSLYLRNCAHANLPGIADSGFARVQARFAEGLPEVLALVV
jgi:hypothetical protein